MSAQLAASIPFSFSRSLSPVRLVELPPALLDLLSNSDSPPTFKIKASDSAISSVHSTENHAVLCTGFQTFSLRQVYSSNSIILLQPCVPASPSDDPGLPTSSMGLRAVSTTGSYMELIPTIHDAESLLLKHVPLYHLPHTPADPVPQLASKAALANALPLSEAEFEAAWRKLHCFSCPAGFARRPAPSAVLRTLAEIFTSAAAEALPLCPPAGFGVDSLLGALGDDDDDEEEEAAAAAIPPDLVRAAVAGVCEEVGADSGKWRLEHAKCARYVGRMLLQEWDAAGRGDMLYVSFMGKWRASVPEECAGLCKLDTIKGWYTHPTPNTIRFVPGGAAAATATATATAAAAPAAPAKNKWHERLGKGKRR